MRIYHDKSYDAGIIENDNVIANAAFYMKDTLSDSSYMECNNSDLFLVVGLDASKYRDSNNGYLDFQKEYAQTVATMVYEMLMME